MKITALFLLLFCGSISFGQDAYPLETVLQKGHKDYIRAYAFTANSEFVITGGFDNILILWNLKSGKQVRSFSGHTARIRSIEISPDQKYVLSVDADSKAILFDINTGQIKYTMSEKNEDFLSGYFNNDGKYAYILNNRDKVFVWNMTNGRKVGTYRKDYAAHHERGIIHPTLPLILSSHKEKVSLLINIESKDTILRIPFDKIYSQSFTKDGKYIAISSAKLFTKIFDAETGEIVHELIATDKRCDGCNTKHVFSADSKTIFTFAGKDDAAIWNVKTGKKLHALKTDEGRPKLIKYNPNGTSVLIVSDKKVFVYSTKTGTEKWRIENEFISYLDIKFTADGTKLILPDKNGGLEVINAVNGRKIKTIKGFLNEEQNDGMNLSYNNWLNQAILQFVEYKRKVLLTPDNNFALVGDVDTVAVLIELETGKEVQRFVGHSKAVYAFDFNKDGSKLATAGGDRKIIIWDVKTGKQLQILTGHQETVFDLKFSEDEKSLISAAWDGTLRTWDLETETYSYILMEKNSPYCVGFSPNELYIVSTDLTKNVQFWERDAEEPFRTLIGHTDIPSGFDFSPNATEMVTCSWDGSVKVWNVLTGMLVNKHVEHHGQVYAVQYHPKNKYIASGGANGEIVLWDPNSNKVVKKLVGHSTSVTSLDFTSDGSKLVSISNDGLMKVWDLENFELIYSRVQMSRYEWLATNPEGYFDGSSKALKWVNYVRGKQVVNVNNLFDKYYTPSLIEQINKGKSFNDRGEVNEVDMDLPLISLGLSGTEKRSVRTLDDSVYKSLTATIPLEVKIEAHDIPLEEIRIYNNGKLILQESMEEDIVFRGGDKNKRIFDLPLVNGKNELKVVAVNTKRTESIPSVVIVDYAGERAKTDLFIVSIGINDYKNPAYNLDYAVNDAKSFVKSIEKGADSLFNEVFTYNILNKNATKKGIEAVIDEVKTEIGSEDVFLFYYAGHGVMSATEAQKESEFFVVTHDLTNLYSGREVLEDKAISASDLMGYSIGIRAEKQLFVLDACHSGGAIEAFNTRGSEREKALAQLARSTGTFFLTASQDAEYANEVGKLNHGLFTYALLEMLEGSLPTEGDGRKITVSELKSYVEERVPELSEEYHGSPQYPTGYSFGRDFPIVILK